MTFEQLQARRDELIALARQHHAENLRIFGSVARGEAGPDSDIDVLVVFRDGASLLDLIGLKQDLEDHLHHHTDVVSERGLHPLIRDRILAEARPL